MTSLQLHRWRIRLALLALALSFLVIDGLSSGISGLPPPPAAAASTPDVIRQFLVGGGGAIYSDDDSSLNRFHVHGWRWHTRSLVRESGRLRNLALKSDLDQADGLKEASSYVVDFNMKGLHKIETQLFFPWIREKLTTLKERELSTAFATVMDQLETDQRRVAELGHAISKSAELACNPNNSATLRSEAMHILAEQSGQLEKTARSMMELEDNFLVPAIARVVPEAEQKSFSNKVLRNLGLMDSRLHLVGMYEAVNELDDALEKDLFEQSIPSIPQMMIPRWKRKLYEPRASMLS